MGLKIFFLKIPSVFKGSQSVLNIWTEVRRQVAVGDMILLLMEMRNQNCFSFIVQDIMTSFILAIRQHLRILHRVKEKFYIFEVKYFFGHISINFNFICFYALGSLSRLSSVIYNMFVIHILG